jgi:hypothetical protein
MIGIEWDTRSLASALRETGESAKHLRDAFKQATDLLEDEWKSRVPVVSGHFKSDIASKARQQSGVVYLPSSRDIDDYIGIREFGGTIPRSETHRPVFVKKIGDWRNVHGAARHNQKRRRYLPPKGQSKDGSYFLYPSFHDREEDIYDAFDEVIEGILHDKFAGHGSGLMLG